MDLLKSLLSDWVIWPCVGVAVVLLLVYLGPLRRRSLDKAPHRDPGLQSEDLSIGILLLLLGGSVSGHLAGSLPVECVDIQYALRQLISQAGQLPLLAYIGWRSVTRGRGLAALGLVSRRPWRDLGVGVVGLATSLPVVLAVGAMVNQVSIRWVEPPPQVQHEMLELVGDPQTSWVAITAMLVSAAMLAPLLEEIIYRGLVQSALITIGAGHHRWSVVLIASCWFTLVHTNVTWQGKPGLFVLAICLGWLYERTGSLWPSIIVHMGFNAVMFFMVLH